MLMHAALDTLLSAKSSSNPTESICPQPSLVEPNETAPLPAPPFPSGSWQGILLSFKAGGFQLAFPISMHANEHFFSI